MTYLSLRMAGTSRVNTVLDLQASLEFKQEGTLQLIPEVPVPKAGKILGTIFGIEFSLGLLVDMKATYALSLSAEGRAVVSATSTVDYSYIGQYGLGDNK